MVMSLPLVARFPSLSTLKNVGKERISVVTCASRVLVSELPLVCGKSTVILRLVEAPDHVPITLTLNVTVVFWFNTFNLLVVVLKNGARDPVCVRLLIRLIRLVGVVGITRFSPLK
nr:MAG TPA: hypothetical protein [Caudoviricetes sp.]